MEALKMEVGCYDERGPDFETYLIGPVTPEIGDAARRIKPNGFPNWAMYRCAYAKDSLLLSQLRLDCIGIALAYAYSGELRKPSDDVAVCAGRDAFLFVVERRWGAPAEELAAVLGVAPNTYRRFREAVARRLEASLQNYWIELGATIRHVILENRRLPDTLPPARLSVTPERMGGIDYTGDGNFRRALK